LSNISMALSACFSSEGFPRIGNWTRFRKTRNPLISRNYCSPLTILKISACATFFMGETLINPGSVKKLEGFKAKIPGGHPGKSGKP
ncbi:MAG: hypothetical protein QXP19_02115, partial [Thermoproteota archaeon]